MIGVVSGQAAALHCEDVALLPPAIGLTHARDTAASLLDIHTFSKFFTEQVPTGDGHALHVVTTRFDPTSDPARNHDSNQDQDLVLRLRASLHSAHMDDIAQSMRVSVSEEHSGKRVIIDGSTEDSDERSVHLDSIELSSSRSYIIKYEFFEKNVGIKSYEDMSVSGSHMGATSCSKPFVV
jgi:hypothetical protein